MKQYILVIIIMALMIAPAGAERISQDVEIRGSIATKDVVYDHTNFAGFWYDLNTNQSSETLTVNVTGRNAVITYQCDPIVQAYKNPELGDYTVIGWQAEKFICYDDKTNELVKLLIEWDNNDDRTLRVGEALEMPDNYTLIVKEIDLDGGKCYLTLYKSGVGIDSEIVSDNTTYKYFDNNDVLVCSLKVAQVFRGTDSNVVIVEYLYLQSEDVIDIDVGDSFGVMEVTSTAGKITLKNDDTIELSENDKVDIMGDLYFTVADSTTLRYHLTQNIKCDESETIYITEYINVTEPCPAVDPEIITVVEYVNVTATPATPAQVPESGIFIPGFEAFLALVGLMGITYLILKQKD